MNFVPTSEKDTKDMLKQIGVNSIDDLIEEFKPPLRKKLNLTNPMSEMELVQHMASLAQKNVVLKYFVGGGSYDHYSPSVINHLLLRGEFLTAYTPYQAEMSQGVLQAMYEFQSFLCLLTGMDLANASLYDGASSLAEAALLSSSYTKKNRVFVNEGLNPNYLDVLKTYCNGADLELTDKIDDKTACVIIQNPDFFGNIENFQNLSEKAHKEGALFITCVVEPTSLAIITPPRNFGADIVVGEGQPFGIPLSYGGPCLGFMAVKKFLLKKIPGRIVGMTTDSKGNEGFVLTFQAREQHIRRERATSNITTNQALLALASTIYLATMGRSGLTNVAKTSYHRAHTLHEKLKGAGFEPLNKKPFYNEFLMRTPKSSEKILSGLLEKKILGGIDLGDDRMLVCCTEKNSIQDIELYEDVVREMK